MTWIYKWKCKTTIFLSTVNTCPLYYVILLFIDCDTMKGSGYIVVGTAATATPSWPFQYKTHQYELRMQIYPGDRKPSEWSQRDLRLNPCFDTSWLLCSTLNIGDISESLTRSYLITHFSQTHRIRKAKWFDFCLLKLA